MKNLRIGIPRGLLYYSYAESWKLFFSELGCEVITSPETHADILKEGTVRASAFQRWGDSIISRENK